MSHPEETVQARVQALLSRTTDLAQHGDLAAAAEAARELTDLAPSFPPGWMLRAVMLSDLEDHAGAAAAFERAAALSDGRPDLVQAAASCHMRAGAFAAAVRLYRASSADAAPSARDRVPIDPGHGGVREALAGGHRLFVRLTPDPRLPLNEAEYDEAYHLESVLGYGDDFWAFGPLYGVDETNGDVTGFGYSGDARYVAKFNGPARGGDQAEVLLYPGDYYKSRVFGFVGPGEPVWATGAVPDRDKVRGLIDAGARFRVFLTFEDGGWASLAAGLLFCFRHQERLELHTAPIVHPALFEQRQADLAPFFDAFHAAALRRESFDSGSDRLSDVMRIFKLTIDTGGALVCQPPLGRWSGRRLARVAIFADRA